MGGVIQPKILGDSGLLALWCITCKKKKNAQTSLVVLTRSKYAFHKRPNEDVKKQILRPAALKSGAWHYFSARKPGWRIENQFSIENLVTNKYWDGFKKTIRDTPKKIVFSRVKNYFFVLLRRLYFFLRLTQNSKQLIFPASLWDAVFFYATTHILFE